MRLFFKPPLTSIWDKQMRSLFFCMFLLPCFSFVTDVNLLLQVFIIVLWWRRLHEPLSCARNNSFSYGFWVSWQCLQDPATGPYKRQFNSVHNFISYFNIIQPRLCLSSPFSFRLYQPVFYRLLVSLWPYNPPWYDYPISRLTSWSTKEVWFDSQQVQISLSFPKLWPTPPRPHSSCSIGTMGLFPRE